MGAWSESSEAQEKTKDPVEECVACDKTYPKCNGHCDGPFECTNTVRNKCECLRTG
jgi:hypothetical protein